MHRRKFIRGAIACFAAGLFALLPLRASFALANEETPAESPALVIVVVESAQTQEQDASGLPDAIPQAEAAEQTEQTATPDETPAPEGVDTPEDAATQDLVEPEAPIAAEPETQAQAIDEPKIISVANEYLFYSLDAEAALALTNQYGGTLLRWGNGLGVMYSENPLDNSEGLFYQQELYLVSSAPYYEQPGETSTKIAAAQGLASNPGAGVVIAVIDSGIDLDHPALADSILDAVSVIPDSAYGEAGYFPLDYLGAQDYFGHGSHVSGILVGQTDEMTIGIAPEAQVLSIKALEKYGSTAAGTTEWMIRAILYAISQQVDIINLSVGGGKSYVSAAQTALKQAADAGILVVAATGNSYTGPTEGIDYPAAYDNTLAVTSVTVEESGLAISDFSRYGVGTDLSAPGVAIYSCNAEGQYVTLSGTSMSCAIVSGIAALLLSEQPDLSPAEVSSILKRSAADVGRAGYDTVYGWGVVDAKAALLLLKYAGPISSDGPDDEAPKPAVPTGPVVAADQDWIETQIATAQSAQQAGSSAQDEAHGAAQAVILPLLLAAGGAALVVLGFFKIRKTQNQKQSGES